MVKKMLLSTAIMGMITFLFLFIFLASSTFGKPEQEEKEISFSFENDQYYYFLTDQEIESTISAGIESLNSIDPYLLVEKDNALLNKEDILFSYIETPKLMIENMAKNIHHQYGRKVRTSEVKLKLTDDYLPFVTRFNKNKGYIYDACLVQGEDIIQPYLVEVTNQGGMASAYFRVEDIDFNQVWELHIVDSLDNQIGVSYQIDFSAYR